MGAETLTCRCRDARFEFRAWNLCDDLVDRLESIGGFDEAATVRDRYVVGPVGSVNVKIRDDEVQVKRLLEVRSGLERWCPTWTATPPLDERGVVRLWGEVGLAAPAVHEVDLDAGADLDDIAELASDDPDLSVVDVTKRRRHGALHGVSAELSEVRRGGRSTVTLALEDTDVDRLGAARGVAELDTFDNVAVHVAVAHRWREVTGDGA